jgi:hypothetical protein
MVRASCTSASNLHSGNLRARGSQALVAAIVLGLLSGARAAEGQAPVPLPNTITTVAGGATGTGSPITGGVLLAKGAACSAGSPYTATDAYGDGCPGLDTVFSSDFRGGLQVDGAGNVFIMDTTNSLVRRLDARSGVVTAVTGTSTSGCTTSTDSYGDGCPFSQTKLSTARGISVDAYGNVLIAGYGMQTINVLCNAVSPLCPNTAGHKQVGSMYRIAGCVGSATATGTTGTGTAAGNTGDGYVASPYGNLAADVADWGGGSTAYGSCTAAATTTIAAVDSPRGVAADRYGNVYIAETGTSGAGYRYRVVVGPASFTLPNGTVLNNPLASILALDPAYSTLTAATAYGKIYTILGGFAAGTGYTIPRTIGAACAGASGASTLDTIGDGCPYYQSTSGTGQQGIGVDASGNVIFADNSEAIVRVLFTEPSVAAGATTTSKMANAIRAANANSALAITQGSVYPIVGAVNAGGTNTALAATPTLGTATSGIPSGITKVAVDSTGNIYIGDFSNSDVLFFDIVTGYVRQLIKTGSVCAAKLDSVGDGCPANASNFGGGAAGMGIGISPEGDLYLADDTNLLIRKITATNLIPLPKGSSVTQSEIFHTAPGTTGLSVGVLDNSTEITAAAATCAAANADGTVDCTVPVTFAPAAPGERANTIAATASGSGGSGLYPAGGVATSAALVSDSATPTTTTFGAVTSAAALAVDGQDNVIVADTGANAFEKIATTGATSTLGGTLPASPYQLAVDPLGDVFATSAGAASITRLTPGAAGTYTSSTFTFIPTQATATTAATTPSAYGIAADRQGNLFVADRTNEAVYEIPAATLQSGTALSSNLNPVVKVAGGFTQLGELALDGSGNLFIADVGANAVLRVLAGSSTAKSYVTGVNPTHIAADAAGDLYLEDTSAKTVTEYPMSGLGTSAVYSGTVTPAGLAINSTGAVFVAVSGASSLTEVERNQSLLNFGTTNGAANYLSGTLTNAGNSPATGTAITTATGSKFLFDTTGTSTCGTIPSTSNTLLAGAACSYTVYFNPATSGASVSANLTLLPSTATGALTLSGTEPSGSTFSTNTMVSGPASAVYLATGAEATYSVQVTATGTADVPTGTVTATIDCATGSGIYPLTNGQTNISLSGCAAGSHTLMVAYPNTGDANTANAAFGASNGSALLFITQASTTVAWTPSVMTRAFSAALGLGVLDATASANGAQVPGTFVYSATNASSASTFIHSASFLPIGTYTLTGTFYPTDSTDYTTSSAMITNFTVTKASTTAAVGVTQMLVAADGTGNYSSAQSAINALPVSGGSVYIKPGTYTGSVTVVQPNVSLRGLGGNPSAVVLQHSGGSFGSSGVYAYAGEFTSAQNNGAQLPAGSSLFSGDEGSATLVVAPGINSAVSASTLTPNGFYGENFTLANTYDTDTTTTTTTYVSRGVCTANAGPAETYNYLYNNSLLCASQALAIWNTSDLSVFNNVYTSSLQDTIYAGSQGAGSNGYVPSRQYWFRGKVTGDVDYIFGDAAAVFDYSTIYSLFHGTSATGTVTIEAQNKARQTGSSTDYLSGYVMNSNVFTSYATGMSSLYFGRPYGTYSTWIMLNSYVDQVAPVGYIEFSGDTNLPTSTYDEYNDMLYTDPAPNTSDVNGVIYTGLGGNTGAGVTGTRETTSQSPGTAMAANVVKTSMTQVEAQAYFPTNFLSMTVPGTVSATANWIPTDAIAAGANGFVPSATNATVPPNTSVTILMRPQTPGVGAITNGVYAIPTGTYTLSDTFNGATTTLASGLLDASGQAYFTTSTLTPGSHALSWTYSGDSNFTGSTTAAAFPLIVNGLPTVTTVSANPSSIAYGQSTSVTVNVASTTANSGTPNGSVTLSVDSATSQTMTLANGSATFTVSGLTPGPHTLIATYAGVTNYATSTSAAMPLTVTQASPTVTVNAATAGYGATTATISATVAYGGASAPSGGLAFTVNGSSTGVGAVSCFGSGSPLTCTASYAPSGLAAGSYPITATEAADNNYGAVSANGTLTITQAAPTLAVSPVSAAYGTASEALTGTISYGGTTAPTGVVTFTVNGSASGVGAVTCSGSASPHTCTAAYTGPSLAGGSYAIQMSEAADINYAAASSSGTLSITRLTPAVSVRSISLTYGATTATLTATLAFTGPAAPSGGLTFLVNGSATGVGTVSCTGAGSPLNCSATYTVGSLPAGSYQVNATEAADGNYTAASDTGTFLVSSATDFAFSNSGGTYQTVVPGASASYTFALSTPFTSYPGPVSFAVSGLPAGATYTITPATVPVTGGAQSVVLSIQTAKVTASNRPYVPWEGGSGAVLAAMLLPVCFRRRLRGAMAQRLVLMLIACAGLATLAGVTGCASGNGFLIQSPTNYTITVTATSAVVQHSSSVTLNLQ